MLKKYFKNDIFHIASMARSGETLLLKILNSHSKIKVVHNLHQEDKEYELNAFNYLKDYEHLQINRFNKVFRPFKLKPGDILILKQGVWEHKSRFRGLVLSRNPLAIFSSLKLYDESESEYDSNKNFWFNNEKRFLRWSKDIDNKLYEMIRGKDPIEQFGEFYNRRMGALAELQLPIVRYEDLVQRTDESIKRVCSILKVDFEEKMLNSHRIYSNVQGHGKNKLSRSIDSSSLKRYKETLSNHEIMKIVNYTKKVASKYGYNLEQELNFES